MHKYGAKSTLCSIKIKGSLLMPHIFIRNFPFCFSVTSCLSTTSICLSVSSNETVIKSETYGVLWHVDPESKTQLVNCKLSPKLPLGHSSLPNIRVIDAYIFWSMLFLSLSHARFLFSLKRNYLCRFSFSFGGFENFAIRWSSDPHLKHFRGVRPIPLLSEWPAARAFYFSCLILLKHFSA